MTQTLGPTLRFETPDFILRSLVLGDESEDWGAWFADPRIARMLNSPPRARTLEQLRKHINLHDRIDRHALGIYTKADNRLIGIRTVNIHVSRQAFDIHIVVGTDSDWGKGAMEQTVNVLYDWGFETRDFLWCEASVLAHNKKMIRWLLDHGWTIAGRGAVTSVTDGKPIEAIKIRIHRDTWRKNPESSYLSGIPAQTGLEPPPAE